MDSKNLRMIALVAVVAVLGVFVYRGMGARNNVPGKNHVALQLQCTVPSAFNSAMGHTQSLHDKAGAVAVQLASIAPNGALAKWTAPQDFDPGDHGQLVAFICATEPYPKLDLAGGSAGNELWLRHTGKGDTPADWQAYLHPRGQHHLSSSSPSSGATRATTRSCIHPATHNGWTAMRTSG